MSKRPSLHPSLYLLPLSLALLLMYCTARVMTFVNPLLIIDPPRCSPTLRTACGTPGTSSTPNPEQRTRLGTGRRTTCLWTSLACNGQPNKQTKSTKPLPASAWCRHKDPAGVDGGVGGVAVVPRTVRPSRGGCPRYPAIFVVPSGLSEAKLPLPVVLTCAPNPIR